MNYACGKNFRPSCTSRHLNWILFVPLLAERFMIWVMPTLINFARAKPVNFKAIFFWEGLPEAKILKICAISMAKMFHIQDSLLCCVLDMITLATINCMMMMIWPWTDWTPTIHPFGYNVVNLVTISTGHWTPKYNY